MDYLSFIEILNMISFILSQADGCEEEVMELLYDDIYQLITLLDQTYTSEVKGKIDQNTTW